MDEYESNLPPIPSHLQKADRAISTLVAKKPLTLETARGRRKLAPPFAQARYDTALHESAHLVAACACYDSCIYSVVVEPTGKGAPRYPGTAPAVLGTTGSAELYCDQEAFVSLAGYYWSKSFGGEINAEGDLHRAKRELRWGKMPEDDLVVHTSANAFVIDHEPLIRAAAGAVVALAASNGELTGPKLHQLVAWIRRRVTRLESRFDHSRARQARDYVRRLGMGKF